MPTYASITDGVEGSWPSEQYFAPASGTCVSGTLTLAGGTAGAIPPSTIRDIVFVSATNSKHDPTKDHRRNWKQIRESGQISMTPYSSRRYLEENFIVSRRYERAAWSRKTAACRASLPYICSVDSGPIRHISSWTQNDHFDSLSGKIPWLMEPSVRTDFDDEIRSSISSTQQAAFADAMSTYDLLSELGEAKETLSFLRSKVESAATLLQKEAHYDEPTYQRARRMTAKQLIRHSDKAFRRLGSRWMEFRYAIMPLVYSIRDINELLDKRDAVYKTSRDRSILTLEKDFAGSSSIHMYDKWSFSTTVRSTVKLAYDRNALRRVVSQTSFNPFKTAWELLPLSFVVDWFFNVGDTIVSATAIDLSSQRQCCTSVKRLDKYETYLFDESSDVSSQNFIHDACGNISVQHIYNRQTDDLLKRRTYEWYDRFVFSRPEPKLQFDPFLNWKRFIDATVLGYQPTKKLLRSLQHGT